MGLFRVIIYGIILSVYAGSLIYDIQFIPRFGSPWWIYKLVMLSMINFTLQTFYSLICFLCALFDWNEEVIHKKLIKNVHVPSYWRQTKLHQICDCIYFTSAFPVGMASCLLFWTLYLINPNLVIPESVAKIIPDWLNHVSHTAPLGFLLVDTLLTCHHAPSRKLGTLVIFSLYSFYITIILGVRFFNGYWLYPVMDHLSASYLALFLLFAGILFWFLYLIGDGLNTMLWGKATHSIIKDSEIAKKQY